MAKKSQATEPRSDLNEQTNDLALRHKVEKALETIQQALANKFGSDTMAQILINADGISIDDNDNIVVCDDVDAAAAARKLI